MGVSSLTVGFTRSKTTDCQKQPEQLDDDQALQSLIALVANRQACEKD